MEELSSNLIRSFCKGIFLFISVGIVPEDWTSNRGKMDTDLVHPSRFESTLDETVFPVNSRFKNLIMRDGGLSIFVIHDDFILPFCVFEPSELPSDDPACFRRSSETNRQIYFLYFIRLECSEHHVKGGFGLGDHDNSGSVLVDAMDERRLEGER